MNGSKLKVLHDGVGSLLGRCYPLLDSPLWRDSKLSGENIDETDGNEAYLYVS